MSLAVVVSTEEASADVEVCVVACDVVDVVVVDIGVVVVVVVNGIVDDPGV